MRGPYTDLLQHVQLEHLQNQQNKVQSQVHMNMDYLCSKHTYQDFVVPAPCTNGKKPSQEIYVPPGRKYSGAIKTEQNEETKENGYEAKGIPVLVTVSKPAGRKSARDEARKFRFDLPKLVTLRKTCLTGLAVEEDISRSPTWNKEESTIAQAPPQVSRKISRTGAIPVLQQPARGTVDVGHLMSCSELAELTNQVPLDKPISSPSRLQKEISYEEDSWEKLYNEDGEFLKPDAMEEVSRWVNREAWKVLTRWMQLTLAVGTVRIVQPKHEIYAQVSENPDEDLSHVIELFDFPAAFKTEDLFNGKSSNPWLKKIW